jgi:hypothetical protein
MRHALVRIALVSVVAAVGCGSPTAPTSTSSTESKVAGVADPTPSPGVAATGTLRIDRAVLIDLSAVHPRGEYAPQVRVTETSGRGSISITGVDIRIPGHTAWSCTTGQTVGPGQTIEIFRRIYGDYPLTFSGLLASGDPVFELRFVDQTGRAGSLTVTAAITPDSQDTGDGSGTLWLCR